MTHDKYYSGKRDVVLVADRIKGAIDLKQAVSFILSDNEVSQVPSPFKENEKVCFLPSRTLYLPIDKQQLIKTGTVRAERSNEMVDTMIWKISENMIIKEGLVVLDLLATNNWERPMYMGTTVSNDSYQNLEKYFQMEGLMYRIAPIESKPTDFGYGKVDSKAMYENLMHKYRFRSIANPKVYLDENNTRIISNYRSIFARLASQLIEEGKKDSAIKVLDKCMEVIPSSTVPLNYLSLSLIESYYQANDIDKAVSYSKFMMDNANEQLRFILSLSSDSNRKLYNEIQLNMAILQELYKLANKYEKGKHMDEVEKTFNQYASQLSAS
jgi:tetratricopeptide (TPR) repeat protein